LVPDEDAAATRCGCSTLYLSALASRAASLSPGDSSGHHEKRAERYASSALASSSVALEI
jgi:hypothetical protein